MPSILLAKSIEISAKMIVFSERTSISVSDIEVRTNILI